jgi:hypothetical protein
LISFTLHSSTTRSADTDNGSRAKTPALKRLPKGNRDEAELKTGRELFFNLTSAARHPSFKGLGFATQDHSWCAFIGDFKTTV